jgi:hypothetical protein
MEFRSESRGTEKWSGHNALGAWPRLRGVDLNHRPLGYEPRRSIQLVVDSTTLTPLDSRFRPYSASILCPSFAQVISREKPQLRRRISALQWLVLKGKKIVQPDPRAEFAGRAAKWLSALPFCGSCWVRRTRLPLPRTSSCFISRECLDIALPRLQPDSRDARADLTP